MRKLFFMIVAGMMALMPVGASEQTIYVYRNDGVIDAFFTYEIDSICYSQYDEDSVWHDSFQVQEIWTLDSLYRTPLALIDSVSFITPPTIYQSDVVEISKNLFDYVLESDTASMLLSISTPQSLIPQIGQKIVTLEMNDIFPIGFAGKVNNVLSTDTGLVVMCSSLRFDEIFESYTNYTSIYGDTAQTNQIKQYRSKKWGIIDPISMNGTLPINRSLTLGFNQLNIPIKEIGDLAVEYNEDLSFTLAPDLHVKSFVQVTKNDGYYVSASIHGTVTFEFLAQLSGGISYSHDVPFTKKARYAIAPLTFIYYEPGLVFNAGVQMSLSAKYAQPFQIDGVRDWSSTGKEVLKPSLHIKPLYPSFSVEGSLEGSIGIGFYEELGFCFIDPQIDNVKFRAEAGTQLTGGLLFLNADLGKAYINTNFYDMCHDSQMDWNLYRTTSISAELAGVEKYLLKPSTITANLRTWDIVPTFSNTMFDVNNATSATAGTEMHGDCLFPLSVGLMVKDEDDKEVDKHYARNKFDHGDKKLEHTFSDLTANTRYTAYPIIQMFGHDVLANPSADLNIHQWVKISNFVVNDSAYDKDQSFTYNGEKYHYKYDCSITVELNTEGQDVQIADWGYAYIDPHNDTAFISLKDFASPHTDSRYVYYRNENKASARFCGYVIFAGQTERYVEATREFPLNYTLLKCDGDDHPHMVDLALTSGTLWSCTNLGASKPEEVGDYYAWGETTTKEKFTQNNYLYYNYNSGYPYYSSIGANISGTMYDAATVNWRDDWRMPTKKEMQELLNECTWTWTTRNGVAGYEVTGSNNNSIFLPFAPVKNGSEYGSVTYYRSSLMNMNSYGGADYAGSDAIKFLENQPPAMGSVLKFMGAVIRPVKSNPQQGQ